jgi:hypothetical protein
MPLVKTTLNAAIDSSIKLNLEPLIQAKTKVAFKLAMTKFKTESENAAKVKPLNKDGIFGTSVEAASIVFSNEMKLLAADISKTVAKAVSDNVDIYIKAGVVNVKITGVTVGAPSPHTIIAQPGIGTII